MFDRKLYQMATTAVGPASIARNQPAEEPPSGMASGIARGSVAANAGSSETTRATGVPVGDVAAERVAGAAGSTAAADWWAVTGAGELPAADGSADDVSGMRNLAPHSGQIPLRPAS